MIGQFIFGDSIIHRLDARAKLFGFIILTAAIITASSPVGYLPVIAAVAVAAVLSSLPLKTVAGSVIMLSRFTVVIFILNAAFFSAEEPIWQWRIITISYEGIRQGINVVFSLVLIITLSNVLTITTPPMELIAAIEALLTPLKLFRIPVEDMAIILSAAIQFIPTLFEETDTIKMAQTARGAKFESEKLMDRARALPPLILPVFLSAFKRADELATAMEARGYRGGKHRTQKAKTPLNRAGWLCILFSAAVLISEILIWRYVR